MVFCFWCWQNCFEEVCGADGEDGWKTATDGFLSTCQELKPDWYSLAPCPRRVTLVFFHFQLDPVYHRYQWYRESNDIAISTTVFLISYHDEHVNWCELTLVCQTKHVYFILLYTYRSRAKIFGSRIAGLHNYRFCF